MRRREQIQEILDAIEKKEYKISYREPNCVTLECDEQGNKYFKICYDNCTGANMYGWCTINIAGHEYTCFPPFYDWSGSDDLIEVDNLKKALSKIDGMWACAEDDEIEYVVDFYRFVKGIKEKYFIQYPADIEEDQCYIIPIPEDIEEDNYDYDDFEYKSIEDKTYALHEDFSDLKEDGNGGFVALAFDSSEKPDKTDGYQCVLLHLNQDYNIIEVKPSDKHYNPKG